MVNSESVFCKCCGDSFKKKLGGYHFYCPDCLKLPAVKKKVEEMKKQVMEFKDFMILNKLLEGIVLSDADLKKAKQIIFCLDIELTERGVL